MSLQPFVCIIGTSEKPEVFYIVVDEVMYKVESTIRCLELIFKMFHSLDIEYPAECESIWLFIQELVFEMKSSKKCPSATAVITDIRYHLQ